MNDSSTFYKRSIEYNNPSGLLQKFFSLRLDELLDGKNATDLGCGAGNDTLYLLNNGFNVTAIDREEEVENILETRYHGDNLNIIIDDFSRINLPNTDLLLANFSLLFSSNLDQTMYNIQKSLNTNGFLLCNIIGKEDDWANTRTSVTREELLEYFIDYDIKYFSEEKYYKDSFQEKNKYWHMYTIIARKK